MSEDGQGKSTPELRTRLNVYCAPGYYRPLNETLGTIPGGPGAPPPPPLGEDRCYPCPPGYYNLPGQTDQTQCYPCDVGFFSLGARTQCSICPRNTFQDEVAAASCKPCVDELMITEVEGATSAEQCKCNLGSWVLEFGAVCEPCGDNVICDELDQEIPKPKNIGDQVDASGNVLVCRPRIACLKLTDTADVLAGKCNVGFEGTACRACVDGYYRNVGDCEKCPDQVTSHVIHLSFTCHSPVID